MMIPYPLCWLFALAASALLTGPVVAQERILTKVQRTHLDASLSPDGAWASYQAQGILYVQRSNGLGGETAVFNAGATMTYLWEKNSASFVIFAQGKLMQVSRDGLTRRQLANLDKKGILDFHFLTPDGSWVYGVRREGFKTIVCRVRLSDGVLQDLIPNVPGVTSLDVDPSGKKLLITATVFLFQYSFFQADLDGKNLLAITSQPLTTPASHGRWLDNGSNFVIEHTGMVGTLGSGFQLWSMAAATGNRQPLTWLPRQRKGVPDISQDRKWIAVLEHRPGTGTSRPLVLPASGGGEAVFGPPRFFMGDRVRFAPDGKAVIYVAADSQTGSPSVRIFEFDRLVEMSPTARPAGSGQITLPLTRAEAGFVFLGFGVSKNPLTIPGLTGTFELDLTLPILMLYGGASQDVKGPFFVPNDNGLVGVTVYLQGLRLNLGQGLKGSFVPLSHIAIAPK